MIEHRKDKSFEDEAFFFVVFVTRVSVKVLTFACLGTIGEVNCLA